MSLSDRQHMTRALELAARGLNTTSPNPRVGCVIVAADGRLLGEGWHQRAGEAHAEVNALDAIVGSDSTSGATAYVTLEPCSHQGRTGPCAVALVAAGVARVVYAMEDPNPAVAGRGLEILRDAGIQVDGPLMEEEARNLNPGFIKRMQTGMPMVRCKLAMSMDGRTAMESGESKWITGPSARQDVQRLRARSCAIITGVDSVLLDDPLLTVRLPDSERQPLRVIVDTHLRVKPSAEIFTQEGRTIVATCAKDRIAASGFECWLLPEKDGRVDLHELLKRLAAEGCNEILLETGATLAGAFVRKGFVDEFWVYMAAKFMGSAARPLLGFPIDTMGAALELSIQDVRAVGPDWRIISIPDPEA